MEVQTRLAQYIREYGIKQTVIASKTGMLDSKVSDILNGKRKLSADDFAKICKAASHWSKFASSKESERTPWRGHAFALRAHADVMPS